MVCFCLRMKSAWEGCLVTLWSRATVADIGVISPYRSQLQVLRHTLSKADMLGVEIDTVDRVRVLTRPKV